MSDRIRASTISPRSSSRRVTIPSTRAPFSSYEWAKIPWAGHCQQKRSNNTSGVPGVHFLTTTRQPLGYWQARIKTAGCAIHRTFSVRKFGKRQAFRLAVAARDKLLDMIEDRPYIKNPIAKRLSLFCEIRMRIKVMAYSLVGMRGFNTPQQSIMVFGAILLLSVFALQASGKYLSWGPLAGAAVGALGVICVIWGLYLADNISIRGATVWLVGLVAYSGWLIGSYAPFLAPADWQQQSVIVGAGIASLSACAMFGVHLFRRSKRQSEN